jgi:hypothetical protein
MATESRTHVIPVRVENSLKLFLEEMAENSLHAPATIGYIALREYAKAHGWKPAKESMGDNVQQDS